MSNWECAYCGHKQTASDENANRTIYDLMVGLTDCGRMGVAVAALRCLNTCCNKLSLTVGLGEVYYKQYNNKTHMNEPFVARWNLLPASSAKPQPNYIPEPIRQDYYEACKIVNDSPKASATLARRCLQGMIRDFCGIQENTLFNEIKKLEKRLKEETAP